MTWYLVRLRATVPDDCSPPLAPMLIDALSEAEARQMAELFMPEGLEIETVTKLGRCEGGPPVFRERK